MANDQVQTFTDGNFDNDVLKAEPLVLVDFWAEWCGPCKRLGPTVDALAVEYSGRVRVGKMNIDDNPTVPFKYQVRGIPTLILFRGGQPVEQIVGVVSKDDLKRRIEKHLGQTATTSQPAASSQSFASEPPASERTPVTTPK
jgi:thioredoxin 1